MRGDLLQARLIQIKREILALKTAKKAGLLLNVNVYQNSNYDFQYFYHKITYDNGTQPIILTRQNNSKWITFFAPEGNEQYFDVNATMGSGSLQLQSTRPITDVEYVGNTP